LKNESHGQQGVQKSRVLFKWRGKTDFYLSKEAKVRRNTHMGGVPGRLSPPGSLSRVFIRVLFPG
jgi:hypothetical protein